MRQARDPESHNATAEFFLLSICFSFLFMLFVEFVFTAFSRGDHFIVDLVQRLPF